MRLHDSPQLSIITPLGRMVACADDDGITSLRFDADPVDGGHSRHLDRLADELARYFAGSLTVFTVPVSVNAGTPFQRAAWAYLRTIPFGQTRTYGQQAIALRAPTAARAVGGANGANPLCLLVPCHRVVGAGGSLTGFAAGVDRKRWLLDHERRRGTLFP